MEAFFKMDEARNQTMETNYPGYTPDFSTLEGLVNTLPNITPTEILTKLSLELRARGIEGYYP